MSRICNVFVSVTAQSIWIIVTKSEPIKKLNVKYLIIFCLKYIESITICSSYHLMIKLEKQVTSLGEG